MYEFIMNRDKIYTSIKNPWSEKPWCTIYTLDGKDKIFSSYVNLLQKNSVQSLLARMDDQQLQIFQILIPLFLDRETMQRIDQDGILSLLVFLGQAALNPSVMQRLELRVGIGLPTENISLRILAYFNYAVKVIQQLELLWFGAYPCIVVYSAANMVLREEYSSNANISQSIDDTRRLINDFLQEALPQDYPKTQLYVIQDKKILSPSTQEVIQILGKRLFEAIDGNNPTWAAPIAATLQRKGKEISAENFWYTAAHALYSKDIILKNRDGLFDEDCDSDLVIMIGWPSETSYQFARKEVINMAADMGMLASNFSPTIKVITKVDKSAPYRDDRYLLNNRTTGLSKTYGSARQELDTLFALAPTAVEKILSTNYGVPCNE